MYPTTSGEQFKSTNVVVSSNKKTCAAYTDYVFVSLHNSCRGVASLRRYTCLTNMLNCVGVSNAFAPPAKKAKLAASQGPSGILKVPSYLGYICKINSEHYVPSCVCRLCRHRLLLFAAAACSWHVFSIASCMHTACSCNVMPCGMRAPAAADRGACSSRRAWGMHVCC